MSTIEKPTSEFAVQCENVYKSYPSRETPGEMRTILNDIDIQVQRGEFVTVVGPTGCGKSTLFRLILGSEIPNAGKVFIAGNNLTGVDRNRGIVFQKYSLFPHLTVLENIVFGLELERFNLFQQKVIPFFYRRARKAFRKQALEYLERTGLQKSDAHKYAHELSGGMRQRVAIAQALIMKPQVLLMDEPFGALDDATREMMQKFVLEQWEQTHMTIFFVTHSLEEALFLGTRVMVLSQHYTTDKPGANPGNQGSKIVIDKEVPKGSATSTDLKYSPEISSLMQQIRTDGLSSEHKQHISTFDLSHPDSYRTVTPEEWRR